MSESYDLDFGEELDLEPKRAQVRIGGKKHVLKEPTGAAVKRYKNASMRAAKLDDGKIVGMDGLADAEYLLVSLCLFEVLPSGEERNTPVPLQIVESWPYRVTSKLYNWLKENGHLHDAETEEQLEKEIEKLQERLAKLRKNGPFPNGQPVTGTSG